MKSSGVAADEGCTRGGLACAGALLLLLAMSLFASVAPARAGACPNEAIRYEQGAVALALPDCRAYELVSPSGSVPSRSSFLGIAALNGERFAYNVDQPAPGSEAEGTWLLSTRGAGGWTMQNVTPPQGGLRSDFFACEPSMFFSSELTSGVLSDGWLAFEGEQEEVCEGDYPELVGGEPRGVANLFLRDNEDGSYDGLIDQVPAGVTPSNALLEDATADLDRVVFAEEAALTPGAPAGLDLYEWSGGEDRLVSVLPDGEPVPGRLANGEHGSAPFTHAVSASGETVFFYSGDDLYARLHAAGETAPGGACGGGEAGACTVQVDSAAPGAQGPGGEGTFVDASEDGSRVFFTDSNRLTADATAKPGEPDLYEYDVGTGSLTDLTVSADGPAEVLGFSGASADGSYVYFVARNALTGGQVNSYGESAIRREPNLYLRHAGTTTFIATLEGKGGDDESDRDDWQESIAGGNDGELAARVSPDGRYLAFNSVKPLTDYDNEPLEPADCTGGRCREIFLYDAQENRLVCVSCASDEAAPTGPAQIELPAYELETPESPRYLQRALLEDGDVFFDTRSPLAPQATNGAANVYEYANGEVHLLSSGTSAGSSKFLDASANGEDVFFQTSQGLVQGDTDNADSVYDARVDGGLTAGASEAATGAVCESAEACKAPPGEAPAQLFPTSSALPTGTNATAPPVPVTPSQPAGEGPAKRSLTRAQKLARALRACAGKPRRRRTTCERQARKRYGAKSGGHAGGHSHRTSGKDDRRTER